MSRVVVLLWLALSLKIPISLVQMWEIPEPYLPVKVKIDLLFSGEEKLGNDLFVSRSKTFGLI